MDVNDGDESGTDEIEIFCHKCGERNDGRTDVCTRCGDRLVGQRPLESRSVDVWVEGQMSIRNATGLNTGVKDLSLLRGWAKSPGPPPVTDNRKTLASLAVGGGGREGSVERSRWFGLWLWFTAVSWGLAILLVVGAVIALIAAPCDGPYVCPAFAVIFYAVLLPLIWLVVSFFIGLFAAIRGAYRPVTF